jgi:hypothetical protein
MLVQCLFVTGTVCPVPSSANSACHRHSVSCPQFSGQRLSQAQCVLFPVQRTALVTGTVCPVPSSANGACHRHSVSCPQFSERRLSQAQCVLSPVQRTALVTCTVCPVPSSANGACHRHSVSCAQFSERRYGHCPTLRPGRALHKCVITFDVLWPGAVRFLSLAGDAAWPLKAWPLCCKHGPTYSFGIDCRLHKECVGST